MRNSQNIITKQYVLNILLGFLFINNSYAQKNLVKNPSFEDYTICPTQSDRFPPNDWYLITVKEFVYSNACNTGVFASVPYNYVKGFSYQYARTGFGYVLSDYVNVPTLSKRLYLQTKLRDSLRGGKSYYVEHFVNSPNSQKLACNNVGVLLTTTAVYVDTAAHPYGVLPANPQILNYGNPVIADTINWIKVSGIYKALGGEQYLTLGNFKYDNQTQYIQFLPTGYACAGYYIDDVSVIPLDSFCLKADAGKDTTIILGDSVFIGSYTNGLDSVKWFVNGTTLIDSIRPGFWVKPTVTTSYMLQQTINGCFSADTVVVTVGAVPLKFTNYALRQAQGDKVENLWQTVNEINVKQFNILKSTDGINFKVIGTIKAQNKAENNYSFVDENISSGITYYKIGSIDFDGRKQYSEVRKMELGIRNLGVSVFPNPAKDYLTIECKDGIKEIKIINQLGQVMQQMQVNKEQLQLDVSQLSPALYLIKIVTQKNVVYNEKFIKQ